MPLYGHNPGKLDRRIALRYPRETQSGTGAITKVWVQGARLWAQWLPTGGREFTAAQARHAEATGVIRIRYRTDLDATWQLRLGDDVFEILALQEVGRRDYLDLTVRALDQSPATNLIERIAMALAATFAAAASAVKGAFTGGAVAGTAALTASAVKDAAASAALTGTATLAASAVKDAASAGAIAATATAAVAQRAASNQRTTSAADRRVTSSGDVRITYQYA